MLRLLKYEMRKTLMVKLILLGITVIAQAIFLYGFWARNDGPLAAGALLLFFTATTGISLMGIFSLITLHKDMNTRLGYMLFMTPNSCYRILGAKVLECGLSVMITGAFFLGLGMLDFSLLLGEESNQMMWDMLKQILSSFSQEIVLDFPHVAALVFCVLASWLCTVTTAYFSDVVSSSLLNGKKGNMFITFLLFLVLNYALSWVMKLIPSSLDLVTSFVLQGLLSLVLACIMYVVTARMMEKYLSV